VQDTSKILHSYKVDRPGIDGGIPFAIAALSRPVDTVANTILVARRCGKGRRYMSDGTPVGAVTSLGTFFSTPLAPTFPLILLHRARTVDIVVHHGPFPFVDVVSGLLPNDVGLVYWHADIVGYTWLKSLATPAIKRTLQRANRVVVLDRSVLSNSPLLAPLVEKCAVAPYGGDVDFWGDAVALAIAIRRILDDPALAGRLSEKNLRRDRYEVSPRSHADGSRIE
jgi:hypothetical protein